MKTDVWIASTDWDYPGVENDDTKLPIANVWFRIGYGGGWLGCAEVQRLRDIYENQGIGFYGVFVPTKGNWVDQVANARVALQYCRGLQFDVEPYSAYLMNEAGLQAWVTNVLLPLQVMRSETKEISLCYDPRPQWLDDWDFGGAVRLVDSLAPMVYTAMYSGQGVWGDPVRAIEEAAGQCPKDKLFRPILQAYQIAPADTLAAFKRTLGYGGVPQLFRRGLTPRETWNAIAAIPDGPVMVPGIPHPVPPKEEEEMSSREYREVDSRLTALEAAKHSHAATPAPARRTKSHTVKSGDTASEIAAAYGISLDRLKALNPGKPRSGNWNVIYPGERFRVS